LAFDDILQLIPRDLIKGAKEDIMRVKSVIEEKKATDRISGERYSATGVFTDGSNIVDERRGCGLAVFSSVSVIYTNKGEEKAVKTITINPEETLMLIFPKFNLVSRANTIMRSFEYLTAIEAIDDQVDVIVFDGSFVTALIDPKTSVRDLYAEIYRILKNLSPTKFVDVYHGILEIIDEKINRFLENVNAKGHAQEKAKFFRRKYYDAYKSILDEIESGIPSNYYSPIKNYLQNYIFLLIEQNFAANNLLGVLERAKKHNVPVVWISKDTESRLVTKNLRSLTLANDQALLDFIMDSKEYLLVEKIVELSKINAETMTIDFPDDVKRYEKTFAVTRKIAERLYTDFSDYAIVYAKLYGPVLQLSYPKALVEDDKLESLLIYLNSISYMGYPKPLIYVHNRSTLRERVAKILSEGMYKLCVESEDRFLCNLLQKSGREQIL